MNLTKWWPQVVGGVAYDNSHLHPFDFVISLAAKGRYAARDVTVHVGFSSHTFTRAIDVESPQTWYTAGNDPRVLCPERHALSYTLPSIVRSLDGRHCFHAGRENYFVVELPDLLPGGQEYWVFFDVRHTGKTNAVLLFVQSAYATSGKFSPSGRRRKPVGFRLLLNAALQNRRVEEPMP